MVSISFHYLGGVVGSSPDLWIITKSDYSTSWCNICNTRKGIPVFRVFHVAQEESGCNGSSSRRRKEGRGNSRSDRVCLMIIIDSSRVLASNSMESATIDDVSIVLSVYL